MTIHPLKPKLCKACKQKFQPQRSLQQVCSLACSIVHARMLKARLQAAERTKERKVIREAREKLKTRQEWLKEAQRWFNLFIRLRDKNEPCISCGRHHQGQYHAGHYRTVGSSPELRFNELNCHKQCQPCNAYLSGNIIKYRQSLIEKIGIEKVEWLEGKHEPLKLTIEQIKAIKGDYKKKCKELK
jgi:hypothetical protein